MSSNELLPLNDYRGHKSRLKAKMMLRRQKRAIFNRLSRIGITSMPRLILAGCLAVLFIFAFSSAILSITLPNPVKLATHRELDSTKVLDRNGVVLEDIFGSKIRAFIPFNQIPQTLKQATIAAEDSNFYTHTGFDIKGILRGVILKPLTGKGVQGGSTITQQLAKNVYLTNSRSIARKIQEFILALEMERLYTKDKILELYLNEIPYGGRIYGAESAAQAFFGISAKDLSLSQAATLAALPQSPTRYSPWGQHPDELLARKDWVLKRMFEFGNISEKQMKEAQKEEIKFLPRKDSVKAPHFVEYVKEQLANKYGEKMLEEGGLTITTTLDWEMQQAATDAIASKAEYNKKQYNAGNAAMVAIDPNTGEVLAMVGSKDYFDIESDGNVNVVIRDRQPGSSIKPIVYATAFEKGYSPATMLMDVKTDFGNGYSPNNYDGTFRGPVSIRTALQGSLNVPAVKTLAYAGVQEAVDMAHRLGITTLNDPDRYGLSLVLGGGEVKLIDLTGAYGVFATGGKKAKTMSVLKVVDKKGRVLEENKPEEAKQVLDPEVAYSINNVLSDDGARAYVFGAGGPLTVPGKTVAAKTGTTDKYKDGWTIGYSPDLVAGVWAGNNDNESMTAASGMVAAPIWNAFMRKALANKPNKAFSVPDGIRTIAVDTLSGKLPTDATPDTKNEIFTSSNLPKESDDVHKKVKVVSFAPDYLAPKNFSSEYTEERIFTELHSERPSNSNWEAPVVTWAKDHGYNNIPNQIYTGAVDPNAKGRMIVAPQDSAKVGSNFQITINPPAGEVIEKAEAYYNGGLVGQSTSSPWNIVATVTNADGNSHQLTVKLSRKGKSPITSSINLTVDKTVASSVEAPTIVMKDVTAKSFPLALSANLTNDGKKLDIDKVEIYLDGKVTGTFLTNSNGLYTITVKQGIKGQHASYAKISAKNGRIYESNRINFTI